LVYYAFEIINDNYSMTTRWWRRFCHQWTLS